MYLIFGDAIAKCWEIVWGSGVIYKILNLGTTWTWVVSFALQLFYPAGQEVLLPAEPL
jgi:hypothetical protein